MRMATRSERTLIEPTATSIAGFEPGSHAGRKASGSALGVRARSAAAGSRRAVRAGPSRARGTGARRFSAGPARGTGPRLVRAKYHLPGSRPFSRTTRSTSVTPLRRFFMPVYPPNWLTWLEVDSIRAGVLRPTISPRARRPPAPREGAGPRARNNRRCGSRVSSSTTSSKGGAWPFALTPDIRSRTVRALMFPSIGPNEAALRAPAAAATFRHSASGLLSRRPQRKPRRSCRPLPWGPPP